MFNIKTNLNFEMKRPQLWFLWTIATAISWSLVVYPGWNLWQLHVTSWQIVTSTTWDLFLSTIALGLFVGISQYAILRRYVKVSLDWVLISTFSYAIGSALAFLLSVSSAALLWPDIFLNPDTTFLLTPVLAIMLIGGGLAGLVQAYLVKSKYDFMFQDKRAITLWVLANALSWGLGFFASLYTRDANLPLHLQSGASGLIIGAITGLVLLVQLGRKSAN